MSVRHDVSVNECGSVAERLDRLEAMNRAMGRECRRWRLGAGAAVLVAAVLAAGGANKEAFVPRSLEAKNFVLKDEAGRVRASLGFRQDGTPGFALMDEQSKVRLALDLATNGAPGVNLYDPSGALLAAVAVRPDGSPGLGFFDPTGKIRLSLDSGQRGEAPGLNLFDRSGTLRAAMAVRPDDTPGVGLFDDQGEIFLSLDSTHGVRKPNGAGAGVE